MSNVLIHWLNKNLWKYYLSIKNIIKVFVKFANTFYGKIYEKHIVLITNKLLDVFLKAIIFIFFNIKYNKFHIYNNIY